MKYPWSDDDERRQLRDSVASFVRRELQSMGAAANHDTVAASIDMARWRRIASLGWIGMQLPEHVGGLGLGHGDMVALHQELGRGALAQPLVPVAILATRPIALGSNEVLKQRLLPGLLGGEILASLAWQKAPGCITTDGVGPSATASGAGWILTGEAVFVPIAASADGLVVAAKSVDGVMLFWLDRQSGFKVEPAVLGDGTETGKMVSIDRVHVDRENLIVDAHNGAELLADVLDTASLAACGELLGAMERMLEMTLAYMNQRVQFGKPIGSFQALQHKAVDVYVQIELARSVLHQAVSVYESGATARERAPVVARAKSRCSDAAMLAVKQCIQMHGAIAYTEEYALSRYIRRIITLASSYGGAAAQRRRYAALELDASND